MKHTLLCMTILALFGCNSSAWRASGLLYEPNDEYPFGRPNPAAPTELAQFGFIIGANDCDEQRLNNATGDWDNSNRSWDAYYYMNGFAITDMGRSGSATNGNIRLFDSAEQLWKVTFFSMPAYSTGTWVGGMEEGNMVLRQAQKAPGTDFDGFSRLTFSNISTNGFDWDGEWESIDGSTVVPFWRMQCQKVTV